MASSNRHWPSMFKSKPCNSSHHHQWQQHDMNSSLVSSNGCQRSPYSSGCEERSPEPKPRWNPRPEQIRILEAIFNSGMVNPPRDEIRKIRAQLQEYGQVGDANVFYWFQNRKSRSKHKQRHLQNNKLQSQSQTHDPTPPSPVTSIAVPTAPSSSSSSSDKSYSPNSGDKVLSLGPRNMLLDASSSSPTASVNQPFLQSHNDFLSMAPFFFPVQQQAAATGGGGGGTNNNNNTTYSQGFLTFPPPQNIVSSVADNSVESCSGLLLSDLLVMNHGSSRRAAEDHEKMKLQQLLSYSSTTAPSPLSPTSITSIPTLNTTTLQGVGETGGVGPTKSTVFINDVAFEVTMMAPFNVREAFGDDAVLIHSSGQPVLTNEWGLTIQPLQHGSSYYLIRTLAAPDAPTSTTHHHHHYLDDTTIHTNWYFNHHRHPLSLPLILISFDFVTLIDDPLDFLSIPCFHSSFHIHRTQLCVV